jgi:hypothetical protein
MRPDRFRKLEFVILNVALLVQMSRREPTICRYLKPSIALSAEYKKTSPSTSEALRITNRRCQHDIQLVAYLSYLNFSLTLSTPPTRTHDHYICSIGSSSNKLPLLPLRLLSFGKHALIGTLTRSLNRNVP